MGLITRVLEGARVGAGVEACTVSSTTTVVTLPTVRSASEIDLWRQRSTLAEDLRGQTRVIHDQGAREETRVTCPKEGLVPSSSNVKEVSFVVSAQPLLTETCVGTKKTFRMCKFGLNVLELNIEFQCD